jgi:hypothetical protein
MNNEERAALRARVDAEPDDERGQLARTLMALIDRMHEKSEAEARASLIQMLVRQDHISLEEATRYVDTKPMPAFEHEFGPCRACDGRGSAFEPGCIGGRWKRCDACRGRGKRKRLRLPWAPEGELVDIFGPDPT